jgi:N-acetylglucosamine kinase-like BadF-type ATPase
LTKKSRVVVGLDCGETATIIKIANFDRQIVSEYSVESIWHHTLPEDEFTGNVNRAILSACKENGVGFERIAAIVLVVPGILRNREETALVNALEKQWKRRKYKPKFVNVVTQSLLALEIFFPRQPAVYVSVDSTAYVVARTSKGEFIYAGGWGSALPDPGSSNAIRYSILEYISQVYDNRSATSPYIKKICEEFSVDTPKRFYRSLYNNTIDKQQLVAKLLRAAEERDIVANAILLSAAQGIVELIRHVVSPLPLNKRIPLILTGQLIEREKVYTSMVKRKLAATLPQLELSTTPHNIAESATHYALAIIEKNTA